MYYYKAIIQYDGTGYSGFQWQKATGLTIQHELNQAIATMTEGRVTIAAASRTDAGVHAVEQVVKISSPLPIELASFRRTFNEKLPAQIRCAQIGPCPGDFNPNVDSVSKEYRYLFTNTTRVLTEDRRFISNIANDLDLASIQTCVKLIRGEHDFRNFCSTGSNVRTTIRDVLTCELSEVDPRQIFANAELFQVPKDLGSCYQLKIEARGFLKQMIRHLVSALWMVGSGKISEQEFRVLLDGPKREKRLWKTAPARGLYLYKIQY